MDRFEENISFNQSAGEGSSYYRNSSKLQDGKFERDSIYRSSFNRYNLKTLKFRGNKNPKYPKGGIPVGKVNDDQTLIDNSDSHALVIGATGSMKSRLIVMPSVYIIGAAGESMIISDPKAEIYTRTSGYLKKNGYHIVVINLRNPKKCQAWNPLAIPYSFYKKEDIDRAYEFANDVAFNLTQIEKDTHDPFWDNSAGDLFFGLSILLFKYVHSNNLPDEYVNLSNLIRLRRHLFKNKNSTIISDLYLKELIDNDEIIAGSLSGTIIAYDSTKTSILSVFDEKMRCFHLQPSLLEMLSNNTLDFRSICSKKFAIYFIMPDEKTTYHKLASLFIKQSYEYLIYEAQKNETGILPLRINYILDEFSSLPTIKDFPSMVSAARSRNIRFILVIQSKHQIIERYREEAETIRSNCANWIFLTSRELPLLTDLSTLCGKNKSGKEIAPISALQHLNKEKGQALLLSGRLLPYIAELFDVSKYDNDKYITLEMGEEKRQKYLLDSFIPQSQNGDNISLKNSYDRWRKEKEQQFNNSFVGRTPDQED